MTERALRVFADQRAETVVQLAAQEGGLPVAARSRAGVALARDGCCLRQHIFHWRADHAALCAFCETVSQMGCWAGDDRVRSEVPEFSGRNLRFVARANIERNRLAVYGACWLQDRLASAGLPAPAHFVHGAALCAGQLVALEEPATHQGYAAIAASPDPHAVAASMLDQWRALAATGWSHPGVVHDDAVGCDAATATHGWLQLYRACWPAGAASGHAKAQAVAGRWRSTPLTFCAFATGAGYAAYTPVVWLIKLAFHFPAIISDSATWTSVFGPELAPRVASRITQARPYSAAQISATLSGLYLSG